MSKILQTNTENGGADRRLMYWVHCVRCFEIFVHKKRIFLLLSCNHVCCAECVSKQLISSGNETNCYRCPDCQKLVRGRTLNNMLPPDIKELFHPKPYKEDLPNKRVFEFQLRHRQHFIVNMLKMHRCINNLKKAMETTRQSAKTKFEQLDTVKRERKRLEHRVHQIIKKRKLMEQERTERERLQKILVEREKAKEREQQEKDQQQQQIERQRNTRITQSVGTEESGVVMSGSNRKLPLPLPLPLPGMRPPIAGRGIFPCGPIFMNQSHGYSSQSSTVQSFAHKFNSSFLL